LAGQKRIGPLGLVLVFADLFVIVDVDVLVGGDILSPLKRALKLDMGLTVGVEVEAERGPP
jgi:hypothetical protein